MPEVARLLDVDAIVTASVLVLFMNAPTFDAVRHDAAFRTLPRRMHCPAVVGADGRIAWE